MRRNIWKDQAINVLSLYEARKQSLINIPDQIRELEEKMTSIRSPSADSVSVKGSGGGKDDAYLENIVTRDLLRENLKNNRKIVKRVEAAFATLSDIEMELLLSRWVEKEKETPAEIAKRLGKDKRTVDRMLYEALYNFCVAMYGDG